MAQHQSAEAQFGSGIQPILDRCLLDFLVDAWLRARIGEVPATSLGWFRCGVGFYNKQEFNFSIECFQKAIEIDPLNVNELLYKICIKC
jgi:hypothetical protein